MVRTNYNHSYTWLKYTPTVDTANGQQLPAYVASGILWGSLETSTASKTEYFSSAEEAVVLATVRLRQWPAVSAQDRLVDRRWAETWVIDGVRRTDDNETILQVHKWEQQNGGL